MDVIKENSIIDSILNLYKDDLGKDFIQYQNHVYRVVNFVAPKITTQEEYEIVSISAAFHDIGIWTGKTFNYLPASIRLAREYCVNNSLSEDKANRIEQIINEHHKITRTKKYYLAEIFRQADMTDLTLGLICNNVDKYFIRKVRSCFRNKNFHLNLLRLFLSNFYRHPFNPLPMYKW